MLKWSPKITSTLIMLSVSNVVCCMAMAKAFANEAKESAEKLEVIEVINDHDFAKSNYEILKREDFIGTSQNLSDVLKDVNGIQIRQISGVGNPVSVSIRGSSAKQVQFFIDGQLVNDSQFGSFDLNQIPTDQIESIEISKNQALGTGSTPIGGVIRINTFNPTEDTYKVSAAVGSFGYKELSLLKNKAFKYHSLAIGGTYLASDNDYDYLVPQSFDDPSQSVIEPLRNNEFEKLSLFINDSAQIEQHQLRFNLTFNKQDKALANYQNNSPENNSHIEMDSLRYGIQYNWLSELDYLDNLEVEYYHDEKDELYIDNLTSTRLDTYEYLTTKQHLSLKPSFTFNQFVFSPFTSATQQIFTSESTKNGEPSTCNGISACDIEAKQNQLNIGARLDWQSKSLPFYSYVLANHLREENTNIALNHVDAEEQDAKDEFNTQEVGLSYGDKALKTSLSWSKGVRTPTLYELFGDRGAFKGNDNLLPEKSETYALTLKYDDKLFTANYNLSASVYQQSLENSIVAIFNSSGTGSYTNVSDADLSGLELQASSELTTNLSLSLQAHIIDSNTQSTFVAFDDKKLPGIYHQQYSAALSYQLTKMWKFNINTSLDTDLYFNRSNQFETNTSQNKTGNPADRFVTDISLQWQHNQYSANVNCTNLFDENYQDLANRPAQGRSIQLKLSIKDL